MDNFPYQMIANLRPHTTTAWRIKVRVSRMWRTLNRHGETVALNLILIDELGGRIHASIPPQNIDQLEIHLNEGGTYNVHNFVVRPYSAMQTERCFQNDIYIQMYHMTEVFVTGGVDYIPAHIFQFTDLSAIINAALQNIFLIDVVGILRQFQPIRNFKNKYNQEQSCIRFTINDMHCSAEVTFYNELAHSFHQAIQQADEHPIIVIISSCQSKFIQGEPKLSNLQATRYFLNHNHEAVEDLRNALRLANWRLD
ncbi:hypothetical protein DCAR_0519474 [Daucus carota subsp. sativus]|uniref:Replication protein A 70 kDa DNA-binding subunit B/D first OB fold domain-containing protein n=1 Tax=Daucus carota subsp. sativus TaxID=79200 RepID=A0AAF0X3Y2_DAUCS|nr:hypothetical protein DCAR_0519474 [Daucus carota subsp. sativus]